MFRKILAIIVAVLIFSLVFLAVKFTKVEVPNFNRNLIMLAVVDISAFGLVMWKFGCPMENGCKEKEAEKEKEKEKEGDGDGAVAKEGDGAGAESEPEDKKTKESGNNAKEEAGDDVEEEAGDNVEEEEEVKEESK